MDFALSTIESTLNPIVGDLEFNDASDLHPVDAAEAVAQHMRVRMRFFLAEWFLNRLEGVPYYENILVKNPSDALLRSIFRQVIARTPGVARIDTFSMTLDRPLRRLALTFVATLTAGEQLDSADFGAFVLELP